MRRLLRSRLCLLMQDAAELAWIRLLHIRATNLPEREHPENDWRKHHEQLLRLVCVEARRLLHTLLYRLAMSAEDASEEPATASNVGGWARLQDVRNVVRHAIVRRDRVLDARRTLRLRCVARHAANDHRDRGGDGRLRYGRIDAELLTDLVDFV